MKTSTIAASGASENLKDLRPAARAIFMAVYDLGRDAESFEVETSSSQLAGLTGLTPKTVLNQLNQLVSGGLLTVARPASARGRFASLMFTLTQAGLEAGNRGEFNRKIKGKIVPVQSVNQSVNQSINQSVNLTLKGKIRP
ncbi:MAG: helix-turn-helix domain-containing protein, partial [Acidobacteria bacterium]|nr:helix-turn-helix domain-containing protein [Acidobacteriota bacterium]